jgi:hypothetical protein
VTFVACSAITAILWAAGALAALLAAMLQVRLLVVVGSRFHGLLRSTLGCLASAPTAFVVALLPGWLIKQFGCPDVFVLDGYIGAYAAAVAAYLIRIRASAPQLRAMGFFW